MKVYIWTYYGGAVVAITCDVAILGGEPVDMLRPSESPSLVKCGHHRAGQTGDLLAPRLYSEQIFASECRAVCGNEG